VGSYCHGKKALQNKKGGAMPFRAIWVDNDPSGETGASMGADCLNGVNSEYISNNV
jgi:acyl-ACP thioesterase